MALMEQDIKDNHIIAVVCNQWGDTGKGKIVQYFSSPSNPWADVVVRGLGGDNAGHTAYVNGKKIVFHLIPSGIVNPDVIPIIGNGVVVNLESLLNELQMLQVNNISSQKLMLSTDAHVVMPYHITEDIQHNKSLANGGIGSTGKGIGPCYTDKIARIGITVADLYSKDTMATRLAKVQQARPDRTINIEQIIETMQPLADRVQPFVRDTIKEMHGYIREGKKRILLEGAQGLLLSCEFGTYPYVTSSDCSINGTASGCGIPASAVDMTIGLLKFPFMSKVGGGPFPTELGGQRAELYCREESHRLQPELEALGIPYHSNDGHISYDHSHPKIMELVHSCDAVEKAVGIRLVAEEFGATTGRPRRLGWIDAVAAKYAVNINGPYFILTKADCFADCGDFNIAYEHLASRNKQELSCDFARSSLTDVAAVHKTYAGYSNLKSAQHYHRLPPNFCDAVSEFERFTGGIVMGVSTGPQEKDILFRK